MISYFLFYFLLHALKISPGEINNQNNHTVLCELIDKTDKEKTISISVPAKNKILKSIMNNENLDPNFKFEHYPLNMSLGQWQTLNYCYDENDLGKISSQQILEAIIAANKFDTTQPIKEEELSVMDVIMTKAKKIVTLYDFSNFDQNYIDQIEELKKLFNKVYFDAIKEDVSKNEKRINKFSNFEDWFNALDNDHLKKHFVMFGKLTALLLSEFCTWSFFFLYFDYIKFYFGIYLSQKIFTGCFNITSTLFFYNFFMIFYKFATQGLLQLKKIDFKEKEELYRFYQQSESIVCEELDIQNENILKTWEIHNEDNKEYWVLRKCNEFVHVNRYNPENNTSKYCVLDIKKNACINIPKDFSVTHSLGNNYYILSHALNHDKNLIGKICDDPFYLREGVNWANNIHIGSLENNTISNMQKICEFDGDFLFLNNQCTIRFNNNLDTKKEYITFSLPSDFNNFLHQKHGQIITHIVSLSLKAVFLMYVSYFLAKSNLFRKCNFFNPLEFDSFEEYDLIEKRNKYMPFILKLFNTIIAYQEDFFTYQLLKHFSKKMLMQTFLQKNK